MTAVRVFYVVGLIVFTFGGVRALDVVETHQMSHLVSGLLIAAIGGALLVLAVVRHRRLPSRERRLVYGDAKQSGVIGIVAAAVLTVFGGLAVWAAFMPDVGAKAVPIAVLFFAIAAWSLVDASRKLRGTAQTDTQTTGDSV